VVAKRRLGIEPGLFRGGFVSRRPSFFYASRWGRVWRRASCGVASLFVGCLDPFLSLVCLTPISAQQVE
jgi:hypothetical protein